MHVTEHKSTAQTIFFVVTHMFDLSVVAGGWLQYTRVTVVMVFVAGG
jgi:hypothetical protein